jgi:hypothetical protein
VESRFHGTGTCPELHGGFLMRESLPIEGEDCRSLACRKNLNSLTDTPRQFCGLSLLLRTRLNVEKLLQWVCRGTGVPQPPTADVEGDPGIPSAEPLGAAEVLESREHRQCGFLHDIGGRRGVAKQTPAERLDHRPVTPDENGKGILVTRPGGAYELGILPRLLTTLGHTP